MTISVELSETALTALKQRAEQSGKQPGEVVAEIVEKELSATTPVKPMTERERVRALLKKAGMLSEVSPELLKRYVKPRSRAERDAILKELQQISFSPTFSEMIIADRKSQG
jgi:hypothetical protein